ncbi:hypothetical protein [Cupriavidus sp. AU9028]|uniref:hypothetical protein n=1 Tax=Cupriavidus sp. AU9028 TaxID=2871157 RepID=UPI001C97AE70|nr:hypothetical protein [Cupriavidus sp. AU9028]MBY4898674.1 hypothetical protein [Cupriavidus sp. AU9028]
MPLYNVDIVYRAVIHAGDASAALQVAMQERSEIEDAREPRYKVAGPIRTAKDLDGNWSESDRPYGGLALPSIRELLKTDSGSEQRDTRTIDMFATDHHD